MQHVKSKKTLDFAADVWLSRIQADGDVVCELPAIKGGQAMSPCVWRSAVTYLSYTDCFTAAYIYFWTIYRIFFLFPRELFYPLRSDFFSITAWVIGGSGIKHNLKKVLTVQRQSQGLRLWQRKMSHLCFLWLCLGQWLPNVITSLMIYFLIKPCIILNFKHHVQ